MRPPATGISQTLRPLVAECDGAVAGARSSRPAAAGVTTRTPWRRPAFQRRRIARALAVEGDAWLRSIGADGQLHWSPRAHEFATGLRQAAGYSLDAGMGRYYRNLADQASRWPAGAIRAANKLLIFRQ